MTKFRNQLIIGVAASLLGVSVMFFSAGHVAAQNPGGGAAPVNIVNPIPVPVTGVVRDVGRGAPFTVTSPQTSSTPPEVVFSSHIPAGHLAVVEHVSVRASVCANGTVSLQDFRLRAGNKSVYLIPVRVISTFVNSLMANEQTKFVVEPGETISVETENFASSSPPGCGSPTMDAAISGVVIPAP